MKSILISATLLAVVTLGSAEDSISKYGYRILATNRTSTMEKEMNDAAQDGYVFAGAMGGFLMNLATGRLHDIIGDFTPMFRAAALAYLAALLIIHLLVPRLERVTIEDEGNS